MKIKTKLGISIIALSLTIVGMFSATWYVTNKQKTDGLVINLAGRQRMLTQKITKEIANYHVLAHHDLEGLHGTAAKSAADIANSMEVFEKTLHALLKSGEAPLGLNMKDTKFISIPAPKEPALSQLHQAEELWHPFNEKVESILSNGKSKHEDMKWIQANNMSLLQALNKAVVTMQSQAEKSVSMLLFLQIAGVIIGIISSLFAVINVRSIISRLETIRNFTTRLGEGDFTIKSNVTGVDELGQIGSSLDAMSSNLRSIFGDILGKSRKLNDASDSLQNMSAQVSNGSSKVSDMSASVSQAADTMSRNMTTVAAAVEETSSNVSIMSESANEITGTIKKITSDTENARSITENAVSQSEKASASVNELGKAASEIGKVTETITEISEQTNLLALNATIEAARAGEAGKGFAVVANEIKELAKQTADATGDIRSKIETIQSSTSLTVGEIKDIANIVHEVNEIVSGIASALEEQAYTTQEISTNVAQASEGIQEVTQNVAQSSIAASEVADDITEVNTQTGDIKRISTDLATSASELSNLAQSLDGMVNKFKV